jgi:hypothetical protein
VASTSRGPQSSLTNRETRHLRTEDFIVMQLNSCYAHFAEIIPYVSDAGCRSALPPA